ncbi:MAG: hypothetical protein LBK67_00195 [Coriobacteriales bacterium]|jgi:8-oxo-dGTP pyrophosphatase MutT (NUDIX family)|nr:hypothetical protein [Coriobacteriales bacterium]
MDFATLEQSDITSLLRGYEENHGSYTCLWCDAVFHDEAAVIEHLQREHPQDSCFYHLMSADSLLNFTHTEKIIYQRLYEGVSDKQIADEVGLQYSTIRAMKRDYRKSFVRAKANLLFGSILFDKQPKRKYTKNKADALDLRGLVPWLADDEKTIRGFYSKSAVHDPTDSKRHPSTLILVVKQSLEGSEPIFLIGNRSDKLRQSRLSEAPSLYVWDVCGGHVALEDFKLEDFSQLRSAKDIPYQSMRLTDDVFLNTAKRELQEEIYWQGGKPNPADDLKFLFSIGYETDWRTFDGRKIYGHNIEYTYVYQYILPEKAWDTVRMRDEYTDSLGKTVKRNFPIRFVSYSELLRDYRENPFQYMDGLARILDMFISKRYADADIKTLLAK